MRAETPLECLARRVARTACAIGGHPRTGCGGKGAPADVGRAADAGTSDLRALVDDGVLEVVLLLPELRESRLERHGLRGNGWCQHAEGRVRAGRRVGRRRRVGRAVRRKPADGAVEQLDLLLLDV